MKIERKVKDTLTPVEMDVGDELRLTMPDGTVRGIALERAGAAVTGQGPVPDGRGEGVLRYRIYCSLRIDGRLVQLVRTIPSQESFRPPPRPMGLGMWLDATAEIFDFLEESHGQCRPGRAARLAFWGASATDSGQAAGRICPVLLHPWCPLPPGSLRVADCYRGEDTWLGPYDGRSCHGGLDVNHPAGTPLWAPFRIDEHEMFDSIETGANNNRWRGLHRWPDGSTWVIQSHHVARLLVDEAEPIPAGAHYAEAAGALPGAHEHSHFVFRVREAGEEYMLDPWLLFWQMYEDRKATTAETWGR
jgi:hypothetical protein